MQYVPPELREDAGEIEAALRDKIPADLVTTQDIRGMVHCHTTYSDGKHSVEQMVAAAEALGMKFITITDHSPTAFYAGGVKIDRLQLWVGSFVKVNSNGVHWARFTMHQWRATGDDVTILSLSLCPR